MDNRLNEKYAPVPLNHQAALDEARQRPGFKAAWDALEEKYSALGEMLKGRKDAG